MNFKRQINLIIDELKNKSIGELSETLNISADLIMIFIDEQQSINKMNDDYVPNHDEFKKLNNFLIKRITFIKKHGLKYRDKKAADSIKVGKKGRGAHKSGISRESAFGKMSMYGGTNGPIISIRRK